MRIRTFRLSLLAAVFCLLIFIPAFGRSESSTAEVAAGESSNEKAGEAEEEGSGEGSGDGSESEDEPEEDQYFYLFDKESLVTEYKAPSDDEVEDKPDFLYNPQPGHIRIVEFYAHWCPHCRHFRKHYNDFAKQMKELAKNNNIKLDVYAISCVPHKPVCRDKDILGYPKVKLFVGDNVEEDDGIEINHGSLHAFKVLQLLYEKRGVDGSAVLAQMEGQEDRYSISNEAVAPITEAGDAFWIQKTKYDIYCDVYLSFRFAMQNGIFVGRDLPDEKAKKAFGNWIELLKNTLPPSWPLQVMISEIFNNVTTVLDSEENLLGIVNKYPPPRKTWSHSCSRGDPTMGYTCGLWQLFHTATVGAVEWNVANVAGSGDMFYRPREVGDTIRNYIENFFGCEVCRENFLLEYDGCAHMRCERLLPSIGTLDNWKEVPLWLFEVHNSVNDRLLGERLEKDNRKPTPEEKRAVQWPSRKDCPLCWASHNGMFDYDAVHAFLKLTYWPHELFSSESRKDLLIATGFHKIEDNEESEGFESWQYSLLGVIIVSFILTIVSWQKQQEIHRTGKHKKADDDSYV